MQEDKTRGAPDSAAMPQESRPPGQPIAAPRPGHDAGARHAGHEAPSSTGLTGPEAEGGPMPGTGSGRGPVTGRFFHLIAAETP
ncbi:hypothetical protein A9O63_07635 [Cereibacter johrii]|uniref:Uncharacterized protein n=1 Tax=Cereibacter johrii TaxID=445629 RepID=A0ABX5J3T6_9RHOB|nr:hypothetical protein A9O63_07635 [Cereibacter johrii]PTM76820.1 hypothetical protein C8J29_10798 [Cereibacter johrii]